MIIGGGPRVGTNRYVRGLAKHLLRNDTNDLVAVLQVRGTAASDPLGCLEEMAALGRGTSGKRPLYHAHLNLHPDDPILTSAQELRPVDILEARLGLVGQPRLVMRHRKNGRVHIHSVWCRVHLPAMSLIHLPWSYHKHQAASREIEAEFNCRSGQRFVEVRGLARPEPTITDAEMRQSERTGIHPREARRLVAGIYARVDSASAFIRGLADRNWVLARGDSHVLVLVDPAGGVHSLARLSPAPASELKTRMAGIDLEGLPSVGEIRQSRRIDIGGRANARPSEPIENAPPCEDRRPAPPRPPAPRGSRPVIPDTSELPGMSIIGYGTLTPMLDPLAAARYMSQGVAKKTDAQVVERVAPVEQLAAFVPKSVLAPKPGEIVRTAAGSAAPAKTSSVERAGEHAEHVVPLSAAPLLLHVSTANSVSHRGAAKSDAAAAGRITRDEQPAAVAPKPPQPAKADAAVRRAAVSGAVYETIPVDRVGKPAESFVSGSTAPALPEVASATALARKVRPTIQKISSSVKQLAAAAGGQLAPIISGAGHYIELAADNIKERTAAHAAARKKEQDAELREQNIQQELARLLEQNPGDKAYHHIDWATQLADMNVEDLTMYEQCRNAKLVPIHLTGAPPAAAPVPPRQPEDISRSRKVTADVGSIDDRSTAVPTKGGRPRTSGGVEMD